ADQSVVATVGGVKHLGRISGESVLNTPSARVVPADQMIVAALREARHGVRISDKNIVHPEDDAVVSTDQMIVAALCMIGDRAHISDECLDYDVFIVDVSQRLVLGVLLARKGWIEVEISENCAHG